MIKLFCIPYAGGSASIYNNWAKFFDKSIQVIPIELAGRGKRISEPFYESIEDTVLDVYNQICDQLDGSRYALLGHSMGCTIIYELYYKIKEMNRIEPEIIFFSGGIAPHINERDEDLIHLLPEQEFKSKILNLGGTSELIFENKQLEDLFIPIIRADYKMVENYDYLEKKDKIMCYTVILYGLYDDDNDVIKEWDKLINLSASYCFFEGGHFFIHDKSQEFIDVIQNHIEKLKVKL